MLWYSIIHFYLFEFRKIKLVGCTKDSLNMDRTLLTDFAKSETMRDNKMLIKGLLNNLIKDIDFQNLKGLALKLSLPRPFEF